MSIANRSGREQFREIALEIFHPNYQGGASPYDIALIRLESPIQFNDFVQPIALPPQSPIIPSSGVIRAFGWGSSSGAPPHVLPDELQVER